MNKSVPNCIKRKGMGSLLYHSAEALDCPDYIISKTHAHEYYIPTNRIVYTIDVGVSCSLSIAKRIVQIPVEDNR